MCEIKQIDSKDKSYGSIRLVSLLVFCLFAGGSLEASTTINNVNKHAYGANIGWISCEGDVTNGAVVGETVCSGCLYGANVVWIHPGDAFYGQYCQFEACTAAFNGGSGCYVFNYVRVHNCKPSYNNRDGIAMGYGCTALENSCTLDNPSGAVGYAGIRTFYDDGHIEGNYVRYQAGIGIYVKTNSGSANTGGRSSATAPAAPSPQPGSIPPGTTSAPSAWPGHPPVPGPT